MRPILVIGSGVGGLAAAIELASRGLSVIVLEAQPVLGGKAGREIVDGVEFDTGPSVLTLPSVFVELFGAAGHKFEEHVELMRPEPAFRYLYPDGVEVEIHHQLEATLESVGRTLGSDAKRELETFLEHAAKIWSAAAPNFVFNERPSLARLVGLSATRYREVLAIDPLSTMRAAIHARVRSTHLRRLLSRYATYNGSDLHRAPATLNCIAHVELALGGFGVRGGLYRLIEAMLLVARDKGVEFVPNAKVVELRFSGGKVIGLRLASGEMLESSAVVCNADVGQLVSALLPTELAHELKAPAVRSMSGRTAVFAASPAKPSRAAHTVIFPEDYEREFRDIFDARTAPRDPAIYLCAQDRAHGRGSWPDGRAPLFAMINAPALSDRDDTGPELERMEQRLRSLGLLAEGDRRVWQRGPGELATLHPGSNGALYGAASNGKFAAFVRPANRVPSVPGLYLASGSAHPGGGLPLCAVSGRLAARALLEDSMV